MEAAGSCRGASQRDACADLCSSDRDKIDFMDTAAATPHPLVPENDELEPVEEAAVKWCAGKSPREAMEYREAVVCEIEQRDAALRACGAAHAWLEKGEAKAAEMSAKVDGPLAVELCVRTVFVDPKCVDMLRDGGDIVGKLHCSGLGVPKQFAPAKDLRLLRARCSEQNRNLLDSLSVDQHSDTLVWQMEKDARAERMTEPQDVLSLDLECIVLARRFGVEQGVGGDGLPKVRAVDDESGNQVNSFCEPTEKLHNDRCDKLARLVALFVSLCGVLPWLFKCDVDSAFRRIPVRKSHRFSLRGITYASCLCCAIQVASVGGGAHTEWYSSRSTQRVSLWYRCVRV
jgi:hypothetical protein